MSSTNPSDPRLLLPEWLRDGDPPASTQVVTSAEGQPLDGIEPIANVVTLETVTASEPVVISIAPFSERLSLDTRLDPDQLVSAADLPKWLGGLERMAPLAGAQTIATGSASVAPADGLVLVEAPEPYDGIDAPEPNVIDVQLNGWILVAGAIGLLILILAALRMYLS